MIDGETINNFLYGLSAGVIVTGTGLVCLAIDGMYFKPKRVFKKIKQKYDEYISFDESKELYIELHKGWEIRETKLSNEEKKLMLNLESKLNPQIQKEIEDVRNPEIQKEIQGMKITPRTKLNGIKLSDLSKTYKEVSPYR